MPLEHSPRLTSATRRAFNIRQDQTDDTPDITFEPPTPNTALGFGQIIAPLATSFSSFQQTTNEIESPFATLHDDIFSWQESNVGQDFKDSPRPSSMSGWSMSGTSVSGDESLFSASSPSLTTSPSQIGKSKSHARKKAPGHVNRPRNAFILFRSHAINNDIIPPSLGVKDNRAVSCIIATLWKSLPEDEKKQWKLEAEKEKDLHRMQHPDYQFKPGNCGTKGKERKYAKTDESVKEQCGVIADQILQAHGRTMNRKKDVGNKVPKISPTKKSIKKNESLSKARKSPVTRPILAAEEQKQQEEKDYKDEPEPYQVVPLATNIRRRSLSSPPQIATPLNPSSGSVATETTLIDAESLWQLNLEQSQARPKETFVNLHSFSTKRKSINPTALNLTLQQSSFDLAFPSPRTATSSVQTPRFTHFNMYDRPRSASPVSSPLHEIQVDSDAMLLSPLQDSIFDGKRSSNGWQSWSRLSLADVALPVMKARQSTDTSYSRRGTLFHDYYNTDVFSQSSHLHHTIISPTFQAYHQQQRDVKVKSNSNMVHEDLLQFADELVEQRHIESSSSNNNNHIKNYNNNINDEKENEEEEEEDQLASEQEDDEMLDLSTQSPSLISPFNPMHLALYDNIN